MTKLFKYLNLIILLFAASAAYAETTNCTPITTVPTVISKKGIYCLTGNLSIDRRWGNAIKITVNNVTIDLNGWMLSGLGAGKSTTAIGIFANQRKNITIRNGIVRGFYRGIWLKDVSPYTTSKGHLIEDIRADGNFFVGLRTAGIGNIVRNNQVVDTGGSTVTPNATAIACAGRGARVLNNDINRLIPGENGLTHALFGFEIDGAVIEGNRIDEVFGDGFGIGRGIYLSFSNDVLVVGNRITNADRGIHFNGSTGKYRDNLTSNVTTRFIAGTDAGCND